MSITTDSVAYGRAAFLGAAAAAAEFSHNSA